MFRGRVGGFFVLAFLLLTPFTLAEDDAAPGEKLFHLQYHLSDSSFCNAGVCVDFDDDGRRELLFASRKSKQLSMLNAADGTVRWSKRLEGDQQSLAGYDLNGDGQVELMYTVSSPGRLYLLSPNGNVLQQWDAGDGKLGNSPVVIDADGDGLLEGFFGTRNRSLIRLSMQDVSLIGRREGWGQCGCHTSALDVDGDGRWDLFAGSGDDHAAKGVLHRIDPLSLQSQWTFDTNDNASSADPVLVDIDGDGIVEIIKSVDNYAGDDAHDAVYAFDIEGNVLWSVPGLSGEDSPNVADLDDDGMVEIVGMTFANEVYCLDARGHVRWRKSLRPELGSEAHAYLAPILCDVDGDPELEIVALTNGGYATGSNDEHVANGVIVALDVNGNELDRFNVGGSRYWGEAFIVNVDDDPWQELVIAGQGGLDVIETRGTGPDHEYYQRRRSYQRLNVYPRAYADTYFDQSGTKENLTHRADALILSPTESGYVQSGVFRTELLRLPPGLSFHQIEYSAEQPAGTTLTVSVLDERGRPLRKEITSGSELQLQQSVQLEFRFTTNDPTRTPRLDSYRLEFGDPPAAD